MDFSKAENIIFVAAMGVVILAMLAFLLTLIIKGRRKISGADIALRIFCVIVLIAALALSVLAVFSMLTGDFRIEAKDGAAALISGENVTELPMPALFEALSDLVGAALSFGAVFFTLLVFIVDLVNARKNIEAEKKTAKRAVDKRTPEEKKRDAEIERIRRLASSAVKKTSSAATAETAKPKQSAKAEPADEDPAVEDASDAVLSPEEDEDFDWRVDSAPTKKEFVGISDPDTDDKFDTFDTFDDISESAEPESGAENDDHAEAEYDEDAFDGAGYAEQQEDSSHEEPEEIVDPDTPRLDDEHIVEADEAEAEADEEDIELNRDIYIPEIRTITKTHRDLGAEEPVIKRPDKKHAYVVDKSYVQPQSYAEPTADIAPSKKRGSGMSSPDRSAKEAHAEAVRKKIAQVRKAHEKSAAKRREAEAVAEKEADRPIKRPRAAADDLTKEPAAKQAKPAPKKNGKTSAKRADGPKPDDAKKLPVNRRYVIIDRTSAVNIFNDYLKARDRAEKDKLESMVSTIILK